MLLGVVRWSLSLLLYLVKTHWAHELQRLGGWRTASMVERHAHLASDHLTESAAAWEVLWGYDLATVDQN
jgi:hypothetical protein